MTENKGISVFGLVIAVLVGAAAGAVIATYFANRSNTLSMLNAQSNAIQTPSTHPMPTSIASMSPGTTKYNNKEKWKIVRDAKGDIDSIEVIRDANIDNMT